MGTLEHASWISQTGPSEQGGRPSQANLCACSLGRFGWWVSSHDTQHQIRKVNTPLLNTDHNFPKVSPHRALVILFSSPTHPRWQPCYLLKSIKRAHLDRTNGFTGVFMLLCGRKSYPIGPHVGMSFVRWTLGRWEQLSLRKPHHAHSYQRCLTIEKKNLVDSMGSYS